MIQWCKPTHNKQEEYYRSFTDPEQFRNFESWADCRRKLLIGGIPTPLPVIRFYICPGDSRPSALQTFACMNHSLSNSLLICQLYWVRRFKEFLPQDDTLQSSGLSLFLSFIEFLPLWVDQDLKLKLAKYQYTLGVSQILSVFWLVSADLGFNSLSSLAHLSALNLILGIC